MKSIRTKLLRWFSSGFFLWTNKSSRPPPSSNPQRGRTRTFVGTCTPYVRSRFESVSQGSVRLTSQNQDRCTGRWGPLDRLKLKSTCPEVDPDRSWSQGKPMPGQPLTSSINRHVNLFLKFTTPQILSHVDFFTSRSRSSSKSNVIWRSTRRREMRGKVSST
jgi:hypothetical protein